MKNCLIAGTTHFGIAPGRIANTITKKILVSSSKLGSINHTLLSIEALKNRGLSLHRLYITGIRIMIRPSQKALSDKWQNSWSNPDILTGSYKFERPGHT